MNNTKVPLNRRDALKMTTLAALALPLAGVLSSYAEDSKPSETLGRQKARFSLGMATYSLSKYSVEDIIGALKRLQLTNAALYKSHCSWLTASTEECRAVAAKFRAAGINLTGSGVMYLGKDEALLRKAFDNARAAGLPAIICSPSLDSLPLLNQFVREYDIRAAIHNHGPEDKFYQSPYAAWEAIQAYDQRIGMCLDVGHSARAGVDPIEVIHKCQSRLYDLHLKDSIAPVGAIHDTPAIVGQGHLDIKGILSALVEINYAHIVGFEYEKEDGDRLAGLEKSIKFVRHAISQLNS
jgi:sugar phosphate isomerase/epimerase